MLVDIQLSYQKTMLNQNDNSLMYVEGETIAKQPIDGLNTLNNRINGRNYNNCEDISKSSLVSDELNTLKTDLYNATKSLEKSLSMAEGLKVLSDCLVRWFNNC